MKVTLDYDRVENFHPEYVHCLVAHVLLSPSNSSIFLSSLLIVDRTGRSNLIQSIMTQAILYGSNAGNPLSFSFPPEIDEDSLMAGAEQLSRSILESGRDYRLHVLQSTHTDELNRYSVTLTLFMCR